MVDLALAVAHHLSIFSLMAILAAEIVLVRGEVTAATVRRLSSIDLWYGVMAVVILAVGIARVTLAAKGWAFYQGNPWFWAKMAAFALVGGLSVPPTVAFLRWRRAQRKDETALPDAAAITSVRRYLLAELVLFLAIPALAAAMARYGAF